MDSAPFVIFSYGALARVEFQLSFFGAQLPASRARVRGYRLDRVPIPAAELLPTDREPFRSIAVAVEDDEAVVDGSVVSLTTEQLQRTDAFEAPDYVRRRVVLDDGSRAWMYVPSGS